MRSPTVGSSCALSGRQEGPVDPSSRLHLQDANLANRREEELRLRRKFKAEQRMVVLHAKAVVGISVACGVSLIFSPLLLAGHWQAGVLHAVGTVYQLLHVPPDLVAAAVAELSKQSMNPHASMAMEQVLQSPRYDRPREQTLGRGHT